MAGPSGISIAKDSLVMVLADGCLAAASSTLKRRSWTWIAVSWLRTR